MPLNLPDVNKITFILFTFQKLPVMIQETAIQFLLWGQLNKLQPVKLLLFFQLLSLNFWNLARNMSIYHYLLCCCTVCSIVQRSKLKLKLCMHDNNRTATFEKELNHNQESYLLFHRCASTKTSLPRLLQIEIWPPLCPQWKPKPL